MAEEKRYADSPVWKELSGRRILLMGVKSSLKQSFLPNLSHMGTQMGWEFQVQEDPKEIRKGDLIFIFGLVREKRYASWKELRSLLETLRLLEGSEFEAAALITGTEVYGRLYGKERTIREDEMGYVSHLLEEDTGSFCMRMAENLAGRLAREKNLPVKILRTARTWEDTVSDTVLAEGVAGDFGSHIQQLIQGAVLALLWGKPGQAYNLPWEETSFEENSQNRSPLSPIPLKPDTEKLEQLRKE